MNKQSLENTINSSGFLNILPDNINKIMSCNVNPNNLNEGTYTVSGKIHANDGTKLIYWAPNPPNHGLSYSGSGLPFPNPQVAYENTPNLGSTIVKNGSYQFKLYFPNSFYTKLGTILNEPRVHIKLCGQQSKIDTILLNNQIPYRTLGYTLGNVALKRTQGDCDCNNPNRVYNCGSFGLCPAACNGNNKCSPFFYTNQYKGPLRTQERILIDSQFPKEWNHNFWGGKPPV